MQFGIFSSRTHMWKDINGCRVLAAIGDITVKYDSGKKRLPAIIVYCNLPHSPVNHHSVVCRTGEAKGVPGSWATIATHHGVSMYGDINTEIENDEEIKQLWAILVDTTRPDAPVVRFTEKGILIIWVAKQQSTVETTMERVLTLESILSIFTPSSPHPPDTK